MKKQIAIAAAIILIAIQFSIAQEPVKKLSLEEKVVVFATKNLLSGLRSNNKGVIESAMRITAQMKLRYPAAEMKELLSVLNDVRENHPSGCTRYKAFIAISICTNPEWYANTPNVVTADDETFFHTASDRLQEQLLSVNAQ
ncbi:MAG: hypothetical protein WCX28_12710 [Bacteriovoracaceae bacterium]|nr:hypothetical protein [Bacteroidota bacterium]